MFITQGTFYTGKPGAVEMIEAGAEVTADDLGIDEATCERYLELGLLLKKSAPAKPAKARKAAKSE